MLTEVHVLSQCRWQRGALLLVHSLLVSILHQQNCSTPGPAVTYLEVHVTVCKLPVSAYISNRL